MPATATVTPPPPPAPDLLTGYAAGGTGYDDLRDPDGATRERWAGVAGSLAEMGLAELRSRQREADRLLDEDGVTLQVDGTGEARRTGLRWALDPVPALLTSDEWARIEQGVIERTELLDMVLADLYGPRDLLRTGVLPPEVVWSDPGFLRPCDGVRLPGPAQLVTAGFDLVRDADGRHVVLADRAQAPTGAGFALQNREVTSRVFPSLYRDSEVHRLAPFFRALRSSLLAAAPPEVEDPRVVVLSPGPLSGAAFEDAFLARHLGYSLVEGADLTVRRGRVWLRSLGRLEPVHVVLRRIDPAFCDPVELRSSSHLGVPGLVEACRRGTVSVANPLGAAVLESPGLAAHLPRIAVEVLGHELRLPAVPSWWCGDEGGRREVLDRLDQLLLRRAGRDPEGRPHPSVDGSALAAAERDELAARIAAEPHLWTGAERVQPSTTPTLTARGLEPRSAVLRTFTVARGGSYTVMPGGLTRVAAGASVGVAPGPGATSKDTWVLASEPERLTGFWLQAGPAVEAVAPEGSMSARAAENLFWMGRYAERAEGLVRLLRTVGDRRNDFQHATFPAGRACLAVLLETLGRVTGSPPGFPDDTGAELRALVVDELRPGTLAYDGRRLVDAAGTVRDQLSGDTWPAITAIERELLGPAAATYPQGVGRATLSEVLQALLALAGLAAESMVHDPGWQFMEAGRRVERGLHLLELLRATVTVARDTATDSLVLESLLAASESIITYRRRYRSHAQLETLLDLLLVDVDNPRSLAHQVDRLQDALAALPDGGTGTRLSPAQRPALEAATAIRLADTSALAAVDDGGPGRSALDAFLAAEVDRLRATADAISAAHFVPLRPQRPLA